MAKFDKKPGTRGGRPVKRVSTGTRSSGDGDSDSKKKDYKAKRSFTRNKSLRDKPESAARREGPYRPFERGAGGKFKAGEGKPYKKREEGGFDGEKRERKPRFDKDDKKPYGDKPARSYSKSSRDDDRGERKPRADREEKRSYGDKPARSFGSRDDDRSERKPRFDREEKRSYGDKPARSSSKGKRDDEKPYFSAKDRKPDFDREEKASFGDRPARSASRDDDRGERKPRADREERASYGDKPARSFGKSDDERSERKPRADREEKRAYGDKPARSFGKSDDERSEKKPRLRREDKTPYGDKPARGAAKSKRDDDKPYFNSGERRVKHEDFEEGKSWAGRRDKDDEKPAKPKKPAKPAPAAKTASADGLTRLNKYLSNAGIASRRDADVLIQGGTVKVNGVVVDQLGYKIKAGDKVTYGDSAVKGERKVYLLLNKPKDYITTVDDPQERKTVMELVEGACRERIYPVGRLDRNTTGLLLFTNDGELTTRLTHPKFGIKKVYHVSLNKGLKADDFTAIVEGVELEDGMVKADDLAFVGEGKKEVGIEIHSGRNRVVRRLFEHLGYEVLKLDRVVFAGLTKKDLPRGKHRFLTAKEISFLQMLG